jgi:ABC-type phosphate/phosphonate transport system substrate-binding protein
MIYRVTMASLPMYDFPEVRGATDAWWSGLARHLRRAGIADVPAQLLRRDDLIEQWNDPSLVLSQTCGYLLTHQLSGVVQPIATPHYAVAGCAGPTYSSVILTRIEYSDRGLSDFRGGVAVFSRPYSHAGYNAFRGIIAPLAGGQPFFAEVINSGSHLGSIASLARGQGDLATVDCIIYAFVSRFRPQMLSGTCALGYTPAVPAAPYVAPIGASADTIARLRRAIADALADPSLAGARSDLFIGSFSFDDAPEYDCISALEEAASQHGYPVLR